MTSVIGKKLQKAVTAVVGWRLNHTVHLDAGAITTAQGMILLVVSLKSLTVRACLCWMRGLVTIDQRLSVYNSLQLLFYTLPTKQQEISWKVSCWTF